jgi:hypothetical protein
MQPALLGIKLIAFYRISAAEAKGLTQSPLSVHVECTMYNVQCRMPASYPISSSNLGSTVTLTEVYCHFL